MKMLERLAAGTALALSSMITFAAFGQNYNQTNLVSNISGVAPVTDPALINPWGMSRGSSSPWWISDNGAGVATLYNGSGTKSALTVTIPAAASGKTGTPTGTIFNGSPTDFLIAPGMQAVFLFATIDGTIAGWNSAAGLAQGASPPSTHAVTLVKTTDGSSYTGLTSAFIRGNRYLYAANFNKGTVDVYDNAFHRVDLHRSQFHEHGQRDDDDRAFEDEQLPQDYVPFNVQSIGNDIVVTYALHQEGMPFETDGPGFGYVDIYTSTGRLVLRLEHGDWLNAPWGVALAPLDFGLYSHDLLIGQFAGGGTTESSGLIAAYDPVTGRFLGLLDDPTGKPIAINGIWALSPGNTSPNNYDAASTPSAEVYFTAGPNHGSGGLAGYLSAVPSTLIEGNDQ